MLVPGLYEALITPALADLLAPLAPSLVQTLALHTADEASPALARHLARVFATALQGPPEDQAALVHRILALLLEAVPDTEREALARALVPVSPLAELHSVATVPTAGQPVHPKRPRSRMGENALLTNGPQDDRLLPSLLTELSSTDAVDLLCAFISIRGVRLVEAALQGVVQRGGTVRVVTSTYMAGTERLALDRLTNIGASVRVGYESRTTRLHAKAWLLHRNTGLSTAFVGSSNLSPSALVDGLEWNVRLSNVESPHLLQKVATTFEGYWNDGRFLPYDPTEDAAHLDAVLQRESQGGTGNALAAVLAKMAWRPYPYQQEMLDRLHAARSDRAESRCLVVAATGTGKTVIAAFDYKSLCRDKAPIRLLFVAHKREILEQARATFASLMGDASFGEFLVDGKVPTRWEQVFASIQSLDRRDDIHPEHFTMVILDEFHHAEAESYKRLLARLRPQHLLGLTATPERADGRDILHHFDGHPTVELRLWDALDQQLLCPFHYFGLSDGTDLRAMKWRNGGYALEDLEALYTANDARLTIVFRALHDKIGDPTTMRALGFCVSKAHARFMARRFTDAGIPAEAIVSETSTEARDNALRKLKSRAVNVLFTVDIYNEGVDIPDVDTLLMLRPTDSVTLFLQQLGRGLRKADHKAVCTVLDFVGLQHKQFRFDLRYRAITETTVRTLCAGIESGFARLPAGCAIDLDHNLRKQVLQQVKSSILTTEAKWVAELRRLGPDVPLATALYELQVDAEELYRNKRAWTLLRHKAFPRLVPAPQTEAFRRLQSLLHIDDPERVSTYTRWLRQPDAPCVAAASTREVLLMSALHFDLRGNQTPWRSLQESLDELWTHNDLRDEMCALLALNTARRPWPDHALGLPIPAPLRTHARYSRDEVRALLGELTVARQTQHREGVLWSAANRVDVFFVTLHKDARFFSPSTSYRDHAVSDTRFHWESQSTTRETSPTGRRYQRHQAEASHVVLFVREGSKDERGIPQPFVCLGPCTYLSHRGSAPMAIDWELKTPLPARVLEQYRAISA